LLYALQHPRRLSHLLLVGTTAAWDYFDGLADESQRRGLRPEVVTALVDLPTSNEQIPKSRGAQIFMVVIPAIFERESMVVWQPRRPAWMPARGLWA
jgi:hypothetical protein